jgi:hypothetical protein
LHPSNNVGVLIIIHRAVTEASPSQIADAIKRFGISPTTTSLLLVRIGSPTRSNSASSTQEEIDIYQQGLVDQMSDLIEGDMVPLQELPSTSDWKAIKKVRTSATEIRAYDRADDSITPLLVAV